MLDYHFYHFTISARLIAVLEDYVETGRPVGDFLQAVLTNDFMEACGRADESNQINLPAFAGYLYNEMPSGSWGSRKKYDAWVAHGGRRGYQEQVG
jgi:hypothetical protein